MRSLFRDFPRNRPAHGRPRGWPANRGQHALPAVFDVDPVRAAGEFRHVAADGAGRFLRDQDGNAHILGVRIERPKADLLETALKAQGPLDQEVFAAQFERNGSVLKTNEAALLKDLARRPLDNAADHEFETIAIDVLKTMADADTPAEPPDDAGAPAKSGGKTSPPHPESPERLQALLDAASRNRRAAVERAARKEAAFNVAKSAFVAAQDRVDREVLKAGVQFGATLLTKRGRAASPGLAAAIAEKDRAQSEVDRRLEELGALRQEVNDWDAEIRAILNRIGKNRPTG